MKILGFDIGGTKNCGEKALIELENLIIMLKEENAQFVTAGELAQMF